MLDGLATHMEKDPRWGKRTRDNVFFDTKVALAIFFTPLLRKLQLELAEPLRTQLQTQWLARWPKQLWRPGDYDTLAAGSRSSASASSRRRRAPPRASPTTARS